MVVNNYRRVWRALLPNGRSAWAGLDTDPAHELTWCSATALETFADMPRGGERHSPSSPEWHDLDNGEVFCEVPQEMSDDSASVFLFPAGEGLSRCCPATPGKAQPGGSWVGKLQFKVGIHRRETVVESRTRVPAKWNHRDRATEVAGEGMHRKPQMTCL